MQIEELKNFNKDFHEIMSLFYNWWGPLKNKSLLEITKEYQDIRNITRDDIDYLKIIFLRSLF